MEITLKSSLADPLLDVMNFLNEVVLRYPEAVSFAPGRPSERHFDVEGSLGRAALWVESRAAASGVSERAVWNDLGQYNKTNGIINDLIARQLAADEGIAAAPESILVTTGCQEGMAILLLGLIDPASDALLVSDPAYIGIPGLARILGLTLIPIPTGGAAGSTPRPSRGGSPRRGGWAGARARSTTCPTSTTPSAPACRSRPGASCSPSPARTGC